MWEGGESQGRGARFILPEQEAGDEYEEGVREQPAENHALDTNVFQSQLDQVERQLTCQMDAIYSSVDGIRTFTAQFLETLSQAFTQLGAPVQFLTYGGTPAYPPNTPSDDDRGDEDDASDQRSLSF